MTNDVFREKVFLFNRLYEIFNEYRDGKIDWEKYDQKCMEVVNRYEETVYPDKLSVEVRLRLASMLNEAKMNPLTVRDIELLSKSIGIVYTFEKGWYLDIPIRSQGNTMFNPIGDDSIQF